MAEKIEPMDVKTEPMEDKSEPVEEKVEPMDEKPEPVDDKVEPMDESETVSAGEGESSTHPLGKLFDKPKAEFIGKENEEVIVNPKPSDLIYLSKCKNSKFSFKKRGAKCLIESCSGIKVDLEETLMSGTLELIDCKEVTISVNPQEPLPTISAERCSSIHFHFYEPTAMGSIYTVQCEEVFVHLQPPHPETSQLDLKGAKEDKQYVTKYADGKLVTEMVVREEGGYTTTEAELTKEQKKEQEIRRMFEAYIRNLISFKEANPGPEDGEKKEEEEEEEKKEKKEGEEDEEVDEDEKEALIALLSKLFGSNIKDSEEKKEYFDNEEEFSVKVDRVAQWMKECKHIIMFTGAGISTSSGIPDYRSGMDTVLKTGPGVWELSAHKADRPEGATVTPIINALPSSTHMAIVELQRLGAIRYTVSQNIDGLHRRSGLSPAYLAELHGNTNLEKCEDCKRQYLRDFETRESKIVFDHSTSRQCPACGGGLRDSIINFGEPLPQQELDSAFKQAEAADLCIVLGSSLRVQPACHIPMEIHKKGGKVVICNLQKIKSYEPDENTMQVFAKCDDFMGALCQRLGVNIPPFVLHRRAKVGVQQREDGGINITVTGLDTDEKDLPYSFIKTAAIMYGEKPYEVSTEPLVLELPGGVEGPLPPVIVQCQGHYGEPTFEMECPPVGGEQVYRMSYEVLARKPWLVSKE